MTKLGDDFVSMHSVLSTCHDITLFMLSLSVLCDSRERELLRTRSFILDWLPLNYSNWNSRLIFVLTCISRNSSTLKTRPNKRGLKL